MAGESKEKDVFVGVKPPTRMSVEAGAGLRRRSEWFRRVTQGAGRPMSYGSGRKDDKR